MSFSGFFTRSRFSVVLIVGGLFAAPAYAADEINIYTTREPGLIEPLIAAYKDKTGVEVKTIFMKDGLSERVLAEGKNSPADILMAVDFGALVDMREKGVTQAVASPAIEAAVPKNLRDDAGNWFGLSMRARILYAAKDEAIESFTYEALADEKYKGKVCIRSGQHPYNTALVAAYIAHHGEAKTENWLRGVKANLARTPAGGDRDVARDILGGICDIGIGNSYYVGLMRSGKGKPEQKAWGEAINTVLPTFEGGGTHVNISGAAIAKHAPNKDAAVKFLEFLVSDEGQLLYAQENYEYPVKVGAHTSPLIEALGKLTVDPLTLDEIATHRKQASELIDKVGFDS
ncbi:MAG: extracellular solute-binding protein [Parvibaculum sp.]|nr:extracellular solute-binding protein [Parvibaculum sp.]